MAAKKRFKIGESAMGGIIDVEIYGKLIKIEAKDWTTKKVVSSGSAMTDEDNCTMKVENYLCELTTLYYACKLIDWIKTKYDIS